jgi:C4-dicarboxylate transporter DctQ subunit
VVKLSPPWRRAAGLLVAALCIAYAAIFFYGGWQLVGKMYEVGIDGDDIPLRRWILQSGIPIGFALLLLRFCQIGWRILIGRDPGFRLGDEFSEVLEKRPVEAD